ncbi:MAG: DUF192 domain-containing protein [Deltaproteobacteria bacterium]|nr:DUF192 domain-containing protein [Deltaproteobacteria bacterium]
MFLILSVPLFCSCQKKNYYEPDTFRSEALKPETSQSGKETMEAFFINSKGEKIQVFLEIADTQAERAKGLMFRKNMPADHGMIFIFEEEEDHQFYMKNTYIPLDMIFVNSQKIIVGIVENTHPLTLDTVGVQPPSKYVIEMNAFFAAKHWIKAGDTVYWVSD